MRTLFVMDSFETVLIDRDTTYALMREAEKRGHELYACRVTDVGRRGRGAFAHAVRVATQTDPSRPILALEKADVTLDEMDVVWMRKDPPFNMRYVFTTYLLDGIDPEKTLVINRPSGLREANEKAFILEFPDVIPNTLVTMSPDDVRLFLEEEGGRCIIKPLDGMGGQGVFLLRSDDPNLSSLIETSTAFGNQHVMCQQYVAAAKQGDKRIILVDGRPVGATLRVPQKGELRGNIHVGARCLKTDLSKRDRHICDTIAPRMRELGLVFVGIDVIGEYLTEINVTSPTGVQEINRLNDDCLEAEMWDWVERR